MSAGLGDSGGAKLSSDAEIAIQGLNAARAPGGPAVPSLHKSRRSARVVAPPRVVAVIPAYNEEKYIASLVLKVRRHADRVLVVDDGSRDLTGLLAVEAGATVVTHPANQGKGAAIRTGLREALELGGQAVVLLDGDGQHRAEHVGAIVAPVLAGEADMVVGSRFIGRDARRNVPGWRVFGQFALNVATRICSGVGLTDSQSGFRALSRDAALLMSERLSSRGFSVESEMQFIAPEHGLRVVETPIAVDYDVPLKRNPVSHGLSVLNGLLRLVAQARPLLFISAPGLVLLMSGLLLGLAVMDIYNTTLQFAIGYALLTVLLVETGLLGLFVGIMLHTMRAFFLETGRRR